MTASPWVIVLAAGAGRRLANVTGGVPKQYWPYDGQHSLLDIRSIQIAPADAEAMEDQQHG